MVSSSRFSEVEEERFTEIIDAAIPENTKIIMQVSGHRNEGSVKVYCERQMLQQQKQCSEILAAPVASSTALITKSPQQVEDRNVFPAETCSPTITTRPNLSTLGTPGLKIVISLSLTTRQRKVMTDH